MEELPQPPKSPYVAALERDSDRYGEETTHDGESMQNIYAESSMGLVVKITNVKLLVKKKENVLSQGFAEWKKRKA